MKREKRFTKTIRLGSLETKVDVNPFGGRGHTDYSGYGSHGKIGRDLNRSTRRENRQEAKNVMRDWS